MELKIIGKISLENLDRKPQRKRPEAYAPEMKRRMESLAEAANEKFGGVVGPDGRIAMSDEDDLRYVALKEEAWARERGLSLEQYRQKQELSDSSLAEQAVTLSLSKALGDRFLSVRSSAWDDYENGIDNLLLDTETGSLVCGFDEVVEGYGQHGQDKKAEKMMRRFRQGGARAKYGLELSSESTGMIRISEQRNLPAFYISLNQTDLGDLLDGLTREEVGEAEKKVWRSLVDSLEAQLSEMKDFQTGIPERLASNLEKSQIFIDNLRKKLDK